MEISGSSQKVDHLVDTLTFLNDIGAADVVSPEPLSKLNRTLTSLKKPCRKEVPQETLLLSTSLPPANHNSVPPSSRSLAQSASTLDELKSVIENFDGCSLRKTALHTVFARGNPKADVMLIGEAPGAEEDRLGKPFVGLSGQLLDRILAAIGLDKDSVYISNIVNWRPPGNRQPTSEEVALCLPFILRHIELISPKVIVLLGGTAVKALLNTSEGIIRIRGKWLTSSFLPESLASIKILATFHPAYLLRSPAQKRLAWLDFLMLKRYLHES